ncbi:MAG TPA: hypothetical protein VFN10_17710 [Thermoanaerobaculia bacterium]|nr:hypothetical protein [Thermoanaerobaculia bacterium]
MAGVRGRGAIILAALVVWSAAAAAKPSRAALDLVRGMTHPTRVGVDRHDAFWVWDALNGTISRTTPAGEHSSVTIDDDVRELDADSDRGAVVLTKSGDGVRVIGWDAKVIKSFTLPFTAGAVAWLDGDEIAVAPRMSGFLAEVWNAKTGARVRQIGAVPAIERPKRGAVAQRTTLLHYDAARHEVLTFDAFNGTLVVFDARGQELRRASIVHPDLAANREFLRKLDMQAIRNGGSSMPTFSNYARLSVTSDGTVWLGERTGDEASVVIAKIARDGAVTRETVRVPECNSVRFEVWQGMLVFFRDPESSLKQCVFLMEVKR